MVNVLKFRRKKYFLFSNKTVITAGIRKTLVRIANKKDPEKNVFRSSLI